MQPVVQAPLSRGLRKAGASGATSGLPGFGGKSGALA
jgi:hypothetical protein